MGHHRADSRRTGIRRRARLRPWGASALALTALLVPAGARAAGALEVLAQEAAQSLVQTPAPSVVVAAPLAADQHVPRGDELALRVAALLAGRIGASARAHTQTALLATARAIAGRAGALVYVQTEISKGDIRTTVDVYPSVANSWDRIRNRPGGPIAHAFATSKLDAEVRSFMPTLVLEEASVHRARHDEQDVLAAACGDVDGDGGDEIVLVSRERVALGRVRAGRFVVDRAAAWSELSPRAAVPVREPLAGAVVEPGSVSVGSTERGALSLTPDFVAHTPLYGIPARGAEGIVCLQPEPSAGAFDGAPVDCAVARNNKPKMAVPAPRFDAFSAAAIADAHGDARTIVAAREPSGKLKLKAADGAPQAPDGAFGAQLAVADLDQDGVPEIAASADGPDDAVDVFSWPSDGAELRPRLHVPAPAGVHALAACPPEQGGAPVLVAVVGGEIWLIRAEARDGDAAAPAGAARQDGP